MRRNVSLTCLAAWACACQGYRFEVEGTVTSGSPAPCQHTLGIAPDLTVESDYSLSKDGSTATDLVTGLVWPRSQLPPACAPQRGAACVLPTAEQYCQALSLGGFSSGWRLPTVAELSSLVDFGNFEPAIETAVFPRAWSGLMWTSSSPGGNPGQPLIVDFADGSTHSGVEEYSYGVICVRSTVDLCPAETSAGRLFVSDGTVLDQATDLRWQQVAAGPFPFSGAAGEGGAQAYCESLTLGPATASWRLPSVKELFSILDLGVSGVSLDTSAFPVIGAPETYPFWSATPYSGGQPSSYVWVLDFVPGYSEALDPTQMAFVRCVSDATQ